jgi:hypothetical protein
MSEPLNFSCYKLQFWSIQHSNAAAGFEQYTKHIESIPEVENTPDC